MWLAAWRSTSKPSASGRSSATGPRWRSFGPATSAARPMPDGRQPEPGGWNRFVLTTDDLAADIDRLRAGGAVFRNDIVEGPGGKQVLVEDPAGNPIELFEPA